MTSGTDYRYLVNQSSAVRALEFHPCHCIGPQGGAPACPCLMRGRRLNNCIRAIEAPPKPRIRVKAISRVLASEQGGAGRG